MSQSDLYVVQGPFDGKDPGKGPFPKPSQDLRAEETEVWYESRTPDGGVWTETSSLKELKQERHGRKDLTFHRFTARKIQLPTTVEEFEL